MTSKAEITQVGGVEVVSANPTFKSRLGAHFKRWWWAHIIAFIVIFLVVLLPVVYVGYPHIAQGDINASTLSVSDMIISDPTPNSFQLNQTQVIGSNSAYHPTIYAFDAAVSLLGAAAAFATVSIPQVQARDGTVVHVDQRLDLSDVGEFGDFAKAVMLNEEIEMNIYGKAGLKEGGLPKITITYNKTVTMKGLNKLQGFAITEMHGLSSNQTNGINANFGGTVYIPNPSVMTISMGNVTLDLFANGTSIGESYLQNLVLAPGNNTLPMLSNVNLSSVLKLVAAYPDGIPLVITGNSVNSSVYNGQNIPYFSEALASNSLNVNLNLSQILT